MALKPSSTADKESAESAEPVVSTISLKDHQAALDQLNQAIAERDEALAELVSDHESTLQSLKDEQVETLNSKDQEIVKLQNELAAAKAAGGDKTAGAKASKPKTLNVVSTNDRSYLVEGGIRVTADTPVKAEWREGNLLDANIKAGLIKEYE